MAIYNAGYLSPIRKKLGNAVGRKWRNLDVLSVYQPNIRNPKTNAQEIVRTRFGAASSIAMNMASALALGFGVITKGTKVPPRSYFIKENWNHIHASSPGSATVDYDELTIAKGSLVAFQFGSPSFATPLTVTVAMTPNTSAEGASANDLAYVMVYDPESGEGILSTGKERSEAEVVVNVPDYWNGHRVHVYGFGVGDADVNPNKVATSRYLGSGTIE